MCSLSKSESAETFLFLPTLEHEVVVGSCIVRCTEQAASVHEKYFVLTKCSLLMSVQSACHRKEAIKTLQKKTHVNSAM